MTAPEIKILLHKACVSSYAPTILEGRNSFLALSKNMVLDNLLEIAKECLDLNDEWQYRRLAELLKVLDLEQLQMLIEKGKSSDFTEIIDVALEFEESIRK